MRAPHDHEFFTFTEIENIPLRTVDKVKDVRSYISQKLTEISDKILMLSDYQKEMLKNPDKLSPEEKEAVAKLAKQYSLR